MLGSFVMLILDSITCILITLHFRQRIWGNFISRTLHVPNRSDYDKWQKQSSLQQSSEHMGS